MLIVGMMGFSFSFERQLREAQVVYLPEVHISREDHEFQLEVIKRLHEIGLKFAIAMEMFQQGFQQALDDYVDYKIDEEEMLRRTEYRKRWGYDPSLYAPIWRFAKEKGVRIYAINAPTELMRRVRDGGLENISDPLLPSPVIDQTEKEKRELREFLRFHPKIEEKAFLDGQNTWDNVMAFAIVRLLEKHERVVVLLGKGHASSLDMGVPRRVALLRPSTKQVILSRDSQAQVQQP